MEDNLFPVGKKHGVIAVFGNKNMLGFSSFHEIEAKAKTIPAFHILGVGRDNVTDGPDHRVNMKKNSICSEVPCTNGFEFTHLLICYI